MASEPSQLAAALAKVQAALPRIAKAQEGKVEGTTKQGKSYSYTYGYADLADVSDAIMPLLGPQGLAFTAFPCTDDQGRLVLDYALIHSGGEERARQFPLWLLLPDRVTAQQIGGYITYARRYCLCAVTGVHPSGEDDDGAGGKELRMDRPRGGPERYNGGDRPHDNTGRVRVPVPGPEHERLRHEPPADTGWDGEDHWVDQPPGELPVAPAPKAEKRGGRKLTPAQAITLHFGRLGITDRTERLIKTTILAGRTEPLETTNDLDDAKQREISDLLGKCRDADALGQLLAAKRAEVPS